MNDHAFVQSTAAEADPKASIRPRRAPLRAPITVNIELTSGCNLQCRHCYNFWREDPSSMKDRVERAKMDRIVDLVAEAGVFHVVLSGGEPFLNFEILEYALTKFRDRGISTSVNSNLMLVKPGRIERLVAAGLDHILTSVNSYDPATNDFMMNKPGVLARVTEGIKAAVAGGIRVSANMVVSSNNADHVYETARYVAGLGVEKLFATRLVPSVTVEEAQGTCLELTIEQARRVVGDLVRAKRDFGIQIGTLISYPLCFLGDLHEFADFVGRGCPAQTGNRMVVNADGMAHACTHESRPYGNILHDGVPAVFARMHEWHDGSYRYEGCAGCAYSQVCGSGCRMAAHAYFGEMDARDPLYVGHDAFVRPYRLDIPPEIVDAVDRRARFAVPDRVRFREEDGYCLINVRWANAFAIDDGLARFLMARQAAGAPFSLDDLATPEARRDLVFLIYKDAVEPVEPALRDLLASRPRLGASVNPFDLPEEAVRLPAPSPAEECVA